MTVGQLLNAMSSPEISEWHAYFRLRREAKETADMESEALRGADEIRNHMRGNR